MKKIFVTLFIVGVLNSFGKTVTLTDDGKPLTNPGMGFNQMYYTLDDSVIPNKVPIDELNTLLDKLSTNIVSYRVSWAKLEPLEGKYNWSYIEKTALPLVAKGRKIALKFYTNFLCDKPDKQATPLWVQKDGAKGVSLDCDKNPKNDAWGANYDDPVLLAKLQKFYKAAAKRYDGKDWVAFIELGSLGRVGEGTAYQVDAIPRSLDIYKKHIDLLRKEFPNTQLIINDDLGKDAVAYALTKGYGVDDHSIGSGRGKTSPEGRSWNKEVLSLAQEKAPIGLEIDTGFKPSAFYRQNIVESGANYARLHSDPRFLVQDSNAMKEVQLILLALGYRLRFPQIEVPDKLNSDQTITIKYKIQNFGVAYGYENYQPVFELLDSKNNVVASVRDNGFKLSSLVPVYGKTNETKAKNIQDRQVNLAIPKLSSQEKYKIVLSVKSADGKSKLNLPYSNVLISQGTYVIQEY